MNCGLCFTSSGLLDRSSCCNIRGRRRRLFCLIYAMAFAWSITTPSAIAQEEGPVVSIPSRNPRPMDQNRRRPSSIRADVKLVLIPVTVTDPFERPVLGLDKKNFRVFEDRAEQKITQFFSEDAPVSVEMLFDASNSMRKKLDQSREALTDFLKMSTPGDEFSLLKFSDRPERLCSFTTDSREIEDNLASIQSGGWTSLYDAIYLALNHMKKAAHGGKALLILSDGGDNNSRYTESELRNMVREADVRVFSISIFDRSPSLERIAEESGGRAYHIHKFAELPDTMGALSTEIHSHYVLGYVPSQAQNDGKYHRVTVKLVMSNGSPKLRVAWRRGYYGPLH
jgi:Ca-activated chloride channel homolog